ncbi:MAG: acyl carrier protein [Christensenella sp.]|uniref:acyl carrier protein n=1 Tax=Christensenella sp. TaxID=1935934 RepID=UPI002B1FCE07|nr:acyl carrier protein [Christensenella sp.]MEA5003612.1 acyl carrier protein [Christensenella sp.]
MTTVSLAAVQQLLATASPVDPEDITPDKHLVRDLELDSFSLMDAVLSFEREFNIEIPDRDLRLFDTVQDVLVYLEKKTGAAPEAANAF